MYTCNILDDDPVEFIHRGICWLLYFHRTKEIGDDDICVTVRTRVHSNFENASPKNLLRRLRRLCRHGLRAIGGFRPVTQQGFLRYPIQRIREVGARFRAGHVPDHLGNWLHGLERWHRHQIHGGDVRHGFRGCRGRLLLSDVIPMVHGQRQRVHHQMGGRGRIWCGSHLSGGVVGGSVLRPNGTGPSGFLFFVLFRSSFLFVVRPLSSLCK
jgi:hypothetical protein